MKINIKYNYNQDFETCDVDNIPDIPNYNQITRIDCSYNQLSYLPDLPSTLTYLYCQNNQFITNDKYQENTIKKIINEIAWTRSKEYLIESTIQELQRNCSKCNHLVILEEEYLYRTMCNKDVTIKTKICNKCVGKN